MITPLRRSSKNVIEKLQHMVIITNLLVAARISLVRLLGGYLFEHGVDENVDARIFLNQILEFLNDGVEIFWVVFHLFYDASQPFLVHAVVGWQP